MFRLEFMLKKTFLYIVGFLFLAADIFAQVVSPVSGSWSNRQLLIIDVPPEGNAFYSLNGSDPERMGFAYDGPVLIDLSGEVNLNVSIIDRNGNKILKRISYTVNESPLPKDEVSASFVKDVLQKGFINYSAGDTFSIPAKLEYSLGDESNVFSEGTDLSLSRDMIVSRYLPCVVSDGEGRWRFVIQISPVKSGLFSRKDVPFKIVDWETFDFSDRNFIYKIDDGWWEQPKERVHLDRSVNHMISWQSVDYSKENIVRFYNLPPKPEVKTKTEKDGSVLVSVQGSGEYKLGLLDDKNSTCELYDSINIDTFKGDNYDGSLTVGVFYDSVCQGKLEVPFNIHKRNPQPPVIMPSVSGYFSRSAVRVGLASPEKNDVYYAVAGPVVLDENYSASANDILFDLNSVSYKKHYNAAVVFAPVVEGAAAYRIVAYCLDEHNNRSKPAEYSVIIDQKNYYLDGTVTDPELKKKANGTISYPFTDFSQIVTLINQSRFVHIRVTGDVNVPAGTTTITSNCQIDGVNDARLILAPTTNFVIRNSSVSFSNCIISLSESKNTTESASVFTLERGVLYMDEVEMSAVFGKSGFVINSDNSVVNITNSGITSTAESYSSAISAVDSKITIKKSRLTTVAGTAVNISAKGGLFDIYNSTCIVTGVMGRVAELFDTHSKIVRNNFVGDLKKPQGNNKPVYADDKNYTVEYSENNITGF